MCLSLSGLIIKLDPDRTPNTRNHKQCGRAFSCLSYWKTAEGQKMYDRHLDTFIQVADSGSFIKAGKALFISPNAVTKQINALERALDLTLFRRNNKGVVLTEAGRIIYFRKALYTSG